MFWRIAQHVFDMPGCKPRGCLDDCWHGMTSTVDTWRLKRKCIMLLLFHTPAPTMLRNAETRRRWSQIADHLNFFSNNVLSNTTTQQQAFEVVALFRLFL